MYLFVCICVSLLSYIHVIVNMLNCERHRGAVDTAWQACNVLFSCYQHSTSLLGITSHLASTVLMWSPAIGVPTDHAAFKQLQFYFPLLCTSLQIIFLHLYYFCCLHWWPCNVWCGGLVFIRRSAPNRFHLARLYYTIVMVRVLTVLWSYWLRLVWIQLKKPSNRRWQAAVAAGKLLSSV